MIWVSSQPNNIAICTSGGFCSKSGTCHSTALPAEAVASQVTTCLLYLNDVHEKLYQGFL